MESTPAVISQPRSTPLPMATTALALRTRAHATSHPGLVRPHNEDHFLIADVTSAIRVVQASLCPQQVYFGPNPTGLFVVADGMGGHAAGERASALAVASMERFILGALSRLGAIQGVNAVDLLQASFRHADDTVFNASTQRTSLAGMGTTMTAVLASGSEIFIGHAGDSRAYMLRTGKLFQITRDHTVASELQDAGFINAEEGASHPFRHVVTNAIGGGTRGVSPDIKRLDAQAGDTLLLCSDGLNDMVPDGKLAEILSAAESPELASVRLVQAALEAGGRDNVTAVVVKFEMR
jgi:PPM family protein phosphatase